MARDFAIVTCCNSNWLPFALTTLLSCSRASQGIAVDFFVLVLDLTDTDTRKFTKYCKEQRLEAKLLNLDSRGRISDLATNYLGPATMMRLFLPQCLPSHYKRVLYLDSDVLALQSFASLFAIDMKGKSLAAIEDWFSYPGKDGKANAKEHLDRIGFPTGHRYFNAGVLLMDWQRVLKDKRLENCISAAAAAKSQNRATQMADQDLLNMEFKGDWLKLGLQYNAMDPLMSYFPIKPVFRHFNSQIKPWSQIWIFQQRKARKLYRDASAAQPWSTKVTTRFNWQSMNSISAAFFYLRDRNGRLRMQNHAE